MYYNSTKCDSFLECHGKTTRKIKVVSFFADKYVADTVVFANSALHQPLVNCIANLIR